MASHTSETRSDTTNLSDAKDTIRKIMSIPPYMWQQPFPVEGKPGARACVSIPISDCDGWMDIRIPNKDDIENASVFITLDISGQPVQRFAVRKDHLMKVLSALAIEELAK